MKKRLFFQNAAIMTVTSLLLRTIGIFFRIYVSNRVGAEGMGLYQLIVSVYVLASSFAVSGLTTAVTRLCTDELVCGTATSVKRVLYYAMSISIIVGLLSAAVLIFGAEWIAEICLHDLRAVPSLRILTVSLPFMGASSCIKGYFMARRKVTSSSIAQILEQIVRIAVIVLILEITNADTVEAACFAILLGDSVAEGVSCAYMIVCYLLDKRHLSSQIPPSSQDPLLRRILGIAAPITGGRYLSSGLRTVENVMVPTALTSYTASREISLEQFGKLKGMAMPLIFFPSSFLTAFATLLIPEISEAKALSQKRRLQHTIERSFQVTLLSSFLIAGVFWMLASPLGMLIYHDSDIGYMLKILAPLAPVMYLESVIVGILKGLNQQTHSLIYSVLDSGSRIALIVMVVPSFGMNGFLAVMVFSNLLTCGLNVARLCKVADVRFRFGKWLCRPMLAIGTAVAVAHTVKAIGQIPSENPLLYCIVYGVIICAVYLILLPVLGCVEEEDFISFRGFPLKKKQEE